MNYTTYIIISQIAKKTYVGHTDNWQRRILQHNNGKSIFSKRYRPWVLLYSENFENEKEAIEREKYFKSGTGRRWMKENLF